MAKKKKEKQENRNRKENRFDTQSIEGNPKLNGPNRPAT